MTDPGLTSRQHMRPAEHSTCGTVSNRLVDALRSCPVRSERRSAAGSQSLRRVLWSGCEHALAAVRPRRADHSGLCRAAGTTCRWRDVVVEWGCAGPRLSAADLDRGDGGDRRWFDPQPASTASDRLVVHHRAARYGCWAGGRGIWLGGAGRRPRRAQHPGASWELVRQRHLDVPVRIVGVFGAARSGRPAALPAVATGGLPSRRIHRRFPGWSGTGAAAGDGAERSTECQPGRDGPGGVGAGWYDRWPADGGGSSCGPATPCLRRGTAAAALDHGCGGRGRCDADGDRRAQSAARRQRRR